MAIDFGTLIDGAARSDQINQNGLVIDMEPFTKLLDENSYWFEALTRKIGNGTETTKRWKHEFMTDRLLPSYASVSAASAANATTVYISEYDRVKDDFLLFNTTTKDLVKVTGVPTTTSVTVTEATTGTTPTTTKAWGVGNILVIMGEAHAEGEEVPAAYSNEPTNDFDYVMTKDRRISATIEEEAEQTYDPTKKRARDRKKGWIMYKREQNLLFYLGKRTREVTSASGARRHICGGLIEKLSENFSDMSAAQGAITLEFLSNILGDTKYHSASSDSKIFIGGNKAWNNISAWPREALRVSPNDTKWGIAINSILTGHGSMDVGYDPMLNAKNGLDDRFFIIDTQHVRQLTMQGLPIRMITDIPNLSTVHTKVDAITGTFGLQVSLPELHASGSGVQ
jgi:hypothetical protein